MVRTAWVDHAPQANVRTNLSGRRYQVKKVPKGKPAHYPRWKFVSQMLFGAAWRFIAVDIINTYMRSTPLGKLPIQRRLAEEPLPFGVFKGFVLFCLAGRFGIDMMYRVCAAFLVGLGLYDPSYFPPLMGRKRDAYTVRGFWS